MDANIMNMTLLTSLRTGNIILDLLVAAMIPILFSSFWEYMRTGWYRLSNYCRRVYETNGRVYKRHIAHTKTTPFDDEMDLCANHVLQNAIRTYIGSQLPSAYIRGKVRLTEIKSMSKPANYNRYDSDDEDSSPAGSADGKKSIFDGGRLKVLNLPNTNLAPIEIMPGLLFQENFTMHENREEEEEKRRSQTKLSELVYTLISSGHKGKSGKQVVDDFIKLVMTWYTAEVAKQEDDSRWMYQPLVTSTGSDRLYKRYKLTSEKTFKSLFFHDKARVIKVLDAFMQKSGKYEIKGFPHRLSMLFHGPPGTGKTSLVKAIASYTNRHVVSVPLSRMKTNQEFMDVMMDCVFKYCVPAGANKGDNNGGDDETGEDGGTKRAQLSYDNIVFLLEDVDAASTVVHRKPNAGGGSTDAPTSGIGGRKLTSPKTKKNDAFPTTPLVADEGNTQDEDGGTAPSMDREGTSAYEARDIGDIADDSVTASVASAPPSGAPRQTPPPEASVATAAVESDASDSESESNERRRRRRKQEDTTDQLAKMCQMLIQQQGGSKKGPTFGLADLLAETNSDALSLESILTVLDGVIDTPGRILVMTTNHPERLDPSLIRNGRINMKLYMGHLTCTQVAQMTAHYYPEATKEGIDAVVAAFRTLGAVMPIHTPPHPTGLAIAAADAEGADVIATSKISPAEFEQLCAECFEVWDLAARLSQMGSSGDNNGPTTPCSPIVV